MSLELLTKLASLGIPFLVALWVPVKSKAQINREIKDEYERKVAKLRAAKKNREDIYE